jgi:hypothetical protein
MLLPGTLAPDAELASARYAVGGAISLAGIAGFLTKRPGRPLVDNMAANTALRDDWTRRVDAVVAENAARIAAIRIVVDAGAAEIVELRRP